jgi:poly(3-hydroxybutyrate) depolymerase
VNQRVNEHEMQKDKTMKTQLNLLTAGIFLAAVNAGFGQSTLQFTATSCTVVESAAAVALVVQRVNDPNTVVSVDYATADGTATNGLKYTAVAGTLAFGAGETNQTILVPILNNGLVDGTKTFQVILNNPTNAILGTPTNATVFITDNDAGVAFALASSSVAEEAGAAQIGVVRGDDGILPVTVDLTTTDVTASSGLDYAGTNNTLSFAPTERFKLLTFPILNDSLTEANETFRITLSNPTGGTLGFTKTTTVTIVDNDQGFQFESVTYSVAEDAGAVLIRVTRGDDTNSAGSVDYATSDLTAVSGSDYTGSTNTLSFAPGEKVKVLPVPILNDGITEPTETFRVTLSNPTGGILGTRTITTVTIQDNDPGLGFELSTVSVWEGAGEVNLIVLRGNDWDLGAITVDYATSDLTATAGPDYQALSGTLEFLENETVKSLAIPIFRDALAEGFQTFRVTLSNATGGATLGRTTTTVTIQDNYFTVVPPFNSGLAVRRDGEVNVLTWTGGGQLQRADRVDGPWQTLTAAQSPCAVRSRVPASFYKVKHPRPVTLYVPSGYDPQTPMPVMILLHGYGNSGQGEENYMQLRPLAEARGFLYCYPDAMRDPSGTSFWNTFFWDDADAAALRLHNVDDVGYLRSVIEEVARRFALDRKRVYLVGGSNGGVMAYRMACESADLIASIATRGAYRALDFGLCQPSGPVNILHIHGTADTDVYWGGGAYTIPSYPWNTFPYSSVMLNLQNWASYNGASNPTTEAAPSLDLTPDVPGLDTVVTRYTTFLPGGAVELWTIIGGSHHPTLSTEFSPRIIEWLLAHPKP